MGGAAKRRRRKDREEILKKISKVLDWYVSHSTEPVKSQNETTFSDN
jgi:hypothetical protein